VNDFLLSFDGGFIIQRILVRNDPYTMNSQKGAVPTPGQGWQDLVQPGGMLK
jgi:hypothetical protein